MTRGHERPQTALAAAPSIDGAMSRLHQHEYWRRLPPPWNCETEEALLCTHVRAETHDVKSFFFRSPAGHAFAFTPGQFLTLELDIGGTRLNRCYTISSPPTQPHTLSITVKRVPGGPVSNWLHDHLSAGMSVRTLGPAGVFSNALHPAERYLFLSAGSGITPLMSMARTHRDLCDDRDIVFVHNARTPDDIIFERELDLLASNLSRFRAHFVCEQLGRRPSWHGLTGRLSLPALALMAPDFLTRTVFTCGPAPTCARRADAGPGRPGHEPLSRRELLLRRTSDRAGPGAARHIHRVQLHRAVRAQPAQPGLRGGPDRAGRRARRRPAAAVLVHARHVRHLQGQTAVRRGRHAPSGRHPATEIDQGMVLLCCSRP